MNTTLMKDYAFKVINKYVFVKRVYLDLLVYSQKYGTDIDYLLECVDAVKFNKIVDKTIREYLKQKGN